MLYNAVKWTSPLGKSAKIGNSKVLSETPSWVRTPRSRIVWFTVKNLPCLYMARLRPVKWTSPLSKSAKIENSKVLSEPPSWVRTSRSRIVWFSVKNLPCLYTTRSRPVKWTSPLGKIAKIENSKVLSEPPPWVRTPRSRIVWFPV